MEAADICSAIGKGLYLAFVFGLLPAAIYFTAMNHFKTKWGINAYKRECEAGKVPAEERRQRAEVRWACKWWSPAWWRVVRSWKEDK